MTDSLIGQNKSKHIVLCTEANHEVGLGHAVRCAGLLRLVKLPFKLTVVGNGPLLQEFFPHAQQIGMTGWTYLDWSQWALASVDLVLADIPFYRDRDWERIRFAGAPLAVIDDHGGDIPADIVINGTVLPENHSYIGSRRPLRLFTGGDYALIRPEFVATPWHGMGSGRVTIVVGGGDRARDWVLSLAISARSTFTANKLDIVVGSAFPEMDRLRAICQTEGIELHTGLPAAVLAARLAASAAVLITGGMILYEAMAVRVPAVVFPQIQDLVPEAAWFATRGACFDLGHDNMSPIDAAYLINKILADPGLSMSMSERQRQLIDGHGMERAARILSAQLGTP
jgi:spore coat polysaccharide biosynthesis predicted glycosyltransferase SpsG